MGDRFVNERNWRAQPSADSYERYLKERDTRDLSRREYEDRSRYYDQYRDRELRWPRG